VVGMDAHDFLGRLRDASNAHDVDAIVDCFHDDYVLTAPCHPARAFVGTEQVRRNWSGIFAGVPDLVAEVPSSHVDGDRVWSEWEMRGTRRDGRPHLMQGVIVFTVVDGRARTARFFVEPVDDAPTTADQAISNVTGSPR
jgi:ketosteroid isomerase-like protein